MNEGKPTTKPLLRWAGSKRQHMRHLLARMPEQFSSYVEPFAGSASLFWAIAPKHAILADANQDLITLYKSVRDHPDEVFDVYSPLINDPDCFYEIRRVMTDEPCPLRRSGYFLYLNRYCFNGLYRINRQGHFNVPYGGNRTGSLPTRDILREYSSALLGSELLAGDFEEIVERNVSEGDFVYLDPPFYSSSSRVFNEYTVSPFTSLDVQRFNRTLDLINERGAKFIASYMKEDDSEWDLLWRTEEITVLRRMSGFREGRRMAREVLISNYTAQ